VSARPLSKLRIDEINRLSGDALTARIDEATHEACDRLKAVGMGGEQALDLVHLSILWHLFRLRANDNTVAASRTERR